MSSTYLIVLLYMTGFMLAGLIVVFFIIRAKVQGKIVAFFVDKDKTFKQYLFAPMGKFFKFSKDSERYIIEPKCVMLVRYPFGMFKFLQQVVPCLMYAKGNPQPLNPEDISIVPKGLTAKMVESSVNENIVAGIVAGVGGETGKSRFPAWFFPAVTIFLILIVGLYLYVLSGKIDAIANTIDIIKP